MISGIENKVVLVTGGTSGIGLEIAKQLNKLGASVCISYSKSEEKAKIAKEEIEKYGKQVVLIKADVSIEIEVIKMFEEINKTFGSLDFLVNNAGIDIPQKIETFSFDDWKKIIDVNLHGKFLCLKHAIPFLKKSKNPRVVNIASRLSRKPLFEASAYCCSEAGVDMLTKVSALELSEYRIKVNTVSPGFTRTPLTESIYPSEEAWEKAGLNNPSGRVGEPIDVANVVLFLLSEESNYINGSNIDINGGSTLK